jgi:hypothetical protein
MGVFVSLITAIESPLTAGTRSELAYRTAMRGSALLAHRPEERSKALKVINGFYDIRSKVVHEGHAGKVGLDMLIDLGLLEMTQQILLRYIFLVYMGIRAELPDWVLPDPSILKSNGKRSGAISRILDAVIMDPSLTITLEKELKKHGLSEPQQWKHPSIINSLLTAK